MILIAYFFCTVWREWQDLLDIEQFFWSQYLTVLFSAIVNLLRWGAATKGQVKLTYFMEYEYSWPLVEEALLFWMLHFLFKKTLSEKLIKTKEMTINLNHTLPKISCSKDPFGSSADHNLTNRRYSDYIIKWSKDLTGFFKAHGPWSKVIIFFSQMFESR